MGTVTVTNGTLTQIGGSYLSKTWVRRLDRVTPNPCTSALYSVTKVGTFMRPGDCYFSDSEAYAGYRTQGLNLLHAKFNDALAERAELLVNLAERAQTQAMMMKRLTMIWSFAKALRRRDFRAASRALNLHRIPKGVRRKGKRLSDLWLEYHFGWSPLLADIYSGIGSLYGEPPQGRITERVSQPGLRQTRGTVAAYAAFRYETGIIRESQSASGTVMIYNSDLLLMSELGLVNPLTVAWELVPFSFLVDWFSNVSQVLNSLTGIMGVSIIDPCYSVVTRTVKDVTTRQSSGGPVLSGSGTALTFVRTVGALPGPRLRLQLPAGLSWKRAVTAISLILQQMR